MSKSWIWMFCAAAAVMLQTAGVAHAQRKHDTNDRGAAFKQVGANKVAVDSGGSAGDCRIKDATVTMEPGGKVAWSATVTSRGSNNSYCTSLVFSDQNNSVLFKFPRICSQTLFPVEQTWSNNKLAIPQHLIPNITRVSRADHC
jgi:hypothetical protein